jgi:hypothetical protein
MFANPILKSLKNINYYLIFWTVLAFLFIQLLYIGTGLGLAAAVTVWYSLFYWGELD